MTAGGQDGRQQVLAICSALPEAKASGDRHLAFAVRGRRFAYYLDDHHGDGRLALNCKVPPGDMEALVSLDSRRYFVPAYLGARGWVGVRLDVEDVDWDEVARFLAVAHRLVAPKRLISSDR
jgi:predicted DNA-binding protein (MmcQ/YjbR family)